MCDLTKTDGILAWANEAKAEYKKSPPSYINLKSPNRTRDLTGGLLKSVYEYNAYEKDIAVLNIFFGKNTAISSQTIF